MYCASPERQPTSMQETSRKFSGRKVEGRKVSSKVGATLQRMVHRGASKGMKTSGGILHLIWTMCLNEFAKFVGDRENKEERNENFKPLLNIISEHVAEVLLYQVTE